ncbi:MAG: 50S ribosomal protein L11 methyltransferase [Verrucomicrobia bacterium]|nr:50S ribosomal protein L11 methyltransferase [Verrucomicrobiota bacterium]
MPEVLRQIAVTVPPEADEDVADLLEKEFGQTPASYHDLATGLTTVSVYWGLPAAEVAETRAVLRDGLREMAEGGLNIAPGRISIRKVPPQDWSESWKRHFRPMDLGPRLLVKPTWSRRQPRPGQSVVLLDPGLSFGTGQHATTRFCLEQLVALRRSGQTQSLLDAGMGSGILAIAAAKLGYSPVKAFDFDAEAVRIARENCALNEVVNAVDVSEADLTRLPRKSREQFDVVCANLMYDLLIAERDRLLARLKPGGTLVVAGILETQFAQVEAAFQAARLRRLRARTEKEWRSGSFGRAS